MHYIVNKETKEHRVYDQTCLDDVMRLTFDYRWIEVEADEDGWIEWHGGNLPLPDDALCDTIEINRLGKRTQINNARADMQFFGRRTSITHYRPACYHEWKEEENNMSETEEFEIRYRYGKFDRWTKFRLLSQEGGDLFGWANGEPVALRASNWEVRPIRSTRDTAVEAMYEVSKEAATSRGLTGLECIYEAIREGRIPGVKLDV